MAKGMPQSHAATLPLVNPIAHGDGVGYYAYVRAALIELNLDFTQDYQYANPSFRGQPWMSRA
jgi:hypothetical protein